MTEPDLVRLAIADAPGALDRLCDEWLPVVLGWTARLAGPRVDPEDAAHDVFLVVFRRLPELQQPEAFGAWLYGITRRVISAHRRRAWFRRWLPGGVPEIPAVDGDPARHVEQGDVAARVWKALDALAIHHREVLVLCDLEERADSEVAEMLGVPKGTVKSRLRRARVALRQLVPDLAAEELRAAADDRERDLQEPELNHLGGAR
ncbi:MAG: sigma-70 family RNA polymerase sigma factor [Myxococcota bacterium]